MNFKPIKVNYRLDGKPTSTTLNYNICEFYTSNHSLGVSRADVEKAVQTFVNDLAKEINKLDKDTIERRLLTDSHIVIIEKTGEMLAKHRAGKPQETPVFDNELPTPRPSEPQPTKCDKTPDMFINDWQKNGLDKDQIDKLRANIYEFGDMNLNDGNIFKMHVEDGLHYLEAFEKINYLLIDPKKIHHVNGIAEILAK